MFRSEKKQKQKTKIENRPLQNAIAASLKTFKWFAQTSMHGSTPVNNIFHGLIDTITNTKLALLLNITRIFNLLAWRV